MVAAHTREKNRYAPSDAGSEDARSCHSFKSAMSRRQNGSNSLIYAKNSFSLTYKDPDVEHRFFNYLYVNSHIFGMRIYFLACAFATTLIFMTSHNLSDFDLHAVDTVFFIGTGVSLLALVLTALPQFLEQRENLWTLSAVLHIPSLLLLEGFHEAPNRYRNGFMFGYVLCTAVVCHVRIRRQIVVLVPTSWVCVVAAAFTTDGYWHRHTYMHLLWWAVYPAAYLFAYQMERMKRCAFETIDQAQHSVEHINKDIAYLRSSIVHFFPRTAMRDMLVVPSVRQLYRPYTNVVMVVSDVAGFTSWSSRTDNAVIVDVLCEMFSCMDRLALVYNVEKVCTVGDSFVGAIFERVSAKPTSDGDDLCALPVTDNDTNTDDDDTINYDKKDCEARCVSGIMFAVCILGAIDPQRGASLRQRVGVHLGDVVGGFVGASPPRFDLFGPAMEHTKMMEGSSHVGKVHTSHAVLKHALRRGCPSTVVGPVDHTVKSYEANSRVHTSVSTDADADVVVDSEHGRIFRRWEEHSNDAVDDAEETFFMPRSPLALRVCSLTSLHRDDAHTHEETSCVIRNLRMMTHMKKSPKTVNASPSDRHVKVVVVEDSQPDVGGVDVLRDAKLYPFDWVLLTFRDAAVQAECVRYFRSVPGQRGLVQVALLLQLYVAIVHVSLGCTESVADRVCLVLVFASLAFVVLRHTRLNIYLVAAMLYVPTIPAWYLSWECYGAHGVTPEEQKSRVSDLNFHYHLSAFISWALSLELTMSKKYVMLVFLLSSQIIQMWHRPLVTDDSDVIIFDPMTGAEMFAFLAAAYLNTFNLLTAFRAQKHVDDALATTGKHAQETRGALEVMLPSFVIDKMMAVGYSGGGGRSARHNKTDVVDDDDTGNHNATESCAPSSSAAASSSPAQGKLLWNYAQACVMFLHVECEGTERFEVLQDVLLTIEAELVRDHVRKVKTVGTTMLCVSGIEREHHESGAAATLAMVSAAQRIVTCVFGAEAAAEGGRPRVDVVVDGRALRAVLRRRHGHDRSDVRRVRRHCEHRVAHDVHRGQGHAAAVVRCGGVAVGRGHVARYVSCAAEPYQGQGQRHDDSVPSGYGWVQCCRNGDLNF
eukprot:PhM_4_TR2118/c1_g1_i8/m.57360